MIDPLLAALEDEGSWARKGAVARLGNIRSPVAVPALIRHLADDSWLVRETSAWALAHIGDPAAIEPLKAMARRSGFWRGRSFRRAARRLEKEVASRRGL